MLVFCQGNPEKEEGCLPDEGVDLDGVDVIKLLEGELDLGLVGLDIDDEDEGVVLLNLLHGRLGVERVDNDLVLIKTGRMRNRLAGVLGSTRQLEGLGPVEGGRGANLPVLVGVDLKEQSTLATTEADGLVEAKTYTLKSGLSSGLSLLGTLGGLRGTACIIKDASAIALVTELAKSAAASRCIITIVTRFINPVALGRSNSCPHPPRARLVSAGATVFCSQHRSWFQFELESSRI